MAGLGTLSEARQFLFAALLLADQMIEKAPQRPRRRPAGPDPALAGRAEALAARLELIADALEQTGRQSLSTGATGTARYEP